MPEPLVLHCLSFLGRPQDLGAVLAASKHWKAFASRWVSKPLYYSPHDHQCLIHAVVSSLTYATLLSICSNTLWRPLCQSAWAGGPLMRQMARGLDAQPQAYRAFYVKNRRALHQVRESDTLVLNSAKPFFPCRVAHTYAHAHHLSIRLNTYQARRQRDHLACPPGTTARQNNKAEATIRRYARYFEGLVLFVDVRDPSRQASVYSTAIRLTVENVGRVFHREVGRGQRPEEHFFKPPKAEGAPLDEAARDLLEDKEESMLCVDLTLYDGRTKAMATLSSGAVDSEPALYAMGPDFQTAGRRRRVLAGDGAEFLSAVWVCAWLFVGERQGAWHLEGLAVEVQHKLARAHPPSDATAGTAQDAAAPDEALRSRVALLRCLYHIFRHELLWV